MRKFILSLMLLLTNVMCMNAQDWVVTNYEADELKGNEAYTSYMYTVPGIGSFVFWSNKENQYRIVSDDGIFNYKVSSTKYATYRGEVVTVGLYDEGDVLVDKITMWLDCESDKPTFLETRDAGGMFNPVGQKKKVKKIMAHLKKASGYVRILAPRYGKTDMDLKIPCGKLQF